MLSLIQITGQWENIEPGVESNFMSAVILLWFENKNYAKFQSQHQLKGYVGF